MTSKLLESIDLGIVERLKNDRNFRNRYRRFWARHEVASGIRALRQLRKLRQQEVAALTGTGQSAISRIEKADYEGWTYKTLLKMADVLDARLSITFEPIENVIAAFEASEETPATFAGHAQQRTMASSLTETSGFATDATAGVLQAAAIDWPTDKIIDSEYSGGGYFHGQEA